MNILLTNATDIFAGGEDYVLILARYLKQRGHDVCVSANQGHLLLKKCEESGISTIPIQYGDMGKVFAVGKLLRAELRRRSFDIIHSNANYDRTCAALGAAFTKATHVASIHSAHSIQHNITHLLRNKLGIAHFIADAEAVKDVMITEDNIPAQKITVVPIGVENDTKEFEAKARQTTRAAWGISTETVVVGNVARLTAFKGHKFLLEAIADVVKTRSNVLFPIIGDGELADQLQRQAATLKIEPYVRFLGFQDNLNELYPAFDVYTHSSVELAAEAFPIAILRALATGLPVVCTKVGGIGLMVENGVNGYLVKPEEPRALAEALATVINDKSMATSMGQASFDLFKKQFHASTMAEKVEHVYVSAIAGSNRN